MGDTDMTARLAVFDGQHCAGFVEQIGGRWRATTTDGEIIGTFATQRDAVRALPAIGVFDRA
jgi:hypothetical protein